MNQRRSKDLSERPQPEATEPPSDSPGTGPMLNRQPQARSLGHKQGPERDPAKAALFRDALEAARNLKRTHHAMFASDQNAFRTIVKKAHARIFRLKPGPKADARIANAARARAGGAKWTDLYSANIEHYAAMSDFLRGLAEAGFQRKVNAYLQRHSYLRRKCSKKSAVSESAR